MPPRSKPQRHRLLIALGAAFLLTAAGLPGLAGATETAEDQGLAADDPWRLCAAQTVRAEAERGLPAHLLTAISKVESGRWNAARSASFAWPWAVTSGSEGWFLPSKAEAIAKVRALRAEGRSNIDVGCMQVNLRYHPEAFADLETAFDPASNVDYAADLLKRLRQEARSWTKAIAFYHSRTPKFNGPYRLKVFRAWREERHRANRATAALAP